MAVVDQRDGFAGGLEDGNELEAIAQIAPDHSQAVLDRTLDLIRGQLDLDLVFLTEFVGDQEIVLEAQGEASALRDVATLEGDRIIRVDDPSGAIGGECILEVPLTFSDGRRFGALCCVGPDAQPLDEKDRRFVQVLARVVGDHLEREELKDRNHELRREETALEVLVAALAARDGYTGEHSTEVLELSLATADALEVSGREREIVHQAALLHDVGKIGIPDHILRKDGPLSSAEWTIMRTHPAIGQQIVESTPSLRHLGPAIRAEHERWDGNGYPDGLSGEDIPLASRIVLVCDAFHAMVSDRPYRERMSTREALRRVLQGAGTQFDPNCADALLRILAPVDTPSTGSYAGSGSSGVRRPDLVSLLAEIQELSVMADGGSTEQGARLKREVEEVLQQLGPA